MITGSLNTLQRTPLPAPLARPAGPHHGRGGEERGSLG